MNTKAPNLRSLKISLSKPLNGDRPVVTTQEQMLARDELRKYRVAIARQMTKEALQVRLPEGTKPNHAFWMRAIRQNMVFTVDSAAGYATGAIISAFMLSAMLDNGEVFLSIHDNVPIIVARVNSIYGFNSPYLNWGLPPSMKSSELKPGLCIITRDSVTGKDYQAVVVRLYNGWTRNTDDNYVGVLIEKSVGVWVEESVPTVEIISASGMMILRN